MNQSEARVPIISLGLMSGTSLDGIDAALLETDGERILDTGPFHTALYPDGFRERLRKAVEAAASKNELTDDQVLISDLTSLHCDCIDELLSTVPPDSKWASPSLVGFHGHTTLHRPEQGVTQQIGDPAQIATAFSIPVVSNFRAYDVEHGGQGAPLAPIYHAAMLKNDGKPVCVANIGGIANITWIGPEANDLVAFDTGPGNGLMDAWVEQTTGARFDDGGSLAAVGNVSASALGELLNLPYYALDYPKSLDRSDLSLKPILGLAPPDGLATLLAYTVKTILMGVNQCPSTPLALYVSGGGRHNRTLMARLAEESPCPVRAIEERGWNGDVVEAQAFAFMAVCSQLGLPITFTNTTGAATALTGGELTRPKP
ncbi:MAG: anhydro-N-acetylmuramic acid kinase [Rhodospirillaceae bacterium]|nr:anhydro-N-acetylmuramic acid kinase [Rhodospirillaceae bacterium]